MSVHSHAEHVRQDFGSVHIRTRVTLGCIRDRKRERLAQDLARHVCLRAHIQDLRLDFLHDQGHFAIREGLQLAAKINQGGIHLELAPHLSRRGDDIRPLQFETALFHRLVDLCGNLVQIERGHTLIEDDHRRDLCARSRRAYLTG